jgi:glycosyltransferase involved in cell wall biosynthesis
MKTAYILLWFPKPSETFVFREVMNLQDMGLLIRVFSLYGKLNRKLTPEMQAASGAVERLGIGYLKRAPSEVLHWVKRDRNKVLDFLKSLTVKPWYGLEKTGENLWAFLCALHLARRFREEKIEHIHAPWASGPATAAWIASNLTGIPFSFTCRAWDIYPPDGALKEKIRDAALVRSETGYNITQLAELAGHHTAKIHLTYNGVPLKTHREAPVAMTPPYNLLALGRLVGKKGYDYLISACKILKDAGFDFKLTLAGDGPLKGKLKRLTRRMRLTDRISFPGFVTYENISELFHSADIFLMPSIVHSSGDRDGIPTVIMESLLHRVPVVATNVSGIPEVIENGVTGFLIPQKNSLALARAIVDMARDRKGAIRMADEGREKVFNMFDTKKCHTRVLHLYKKHIPSVRKPL